MDTVHSAERTCVVIGASLAGLFAAAAAAGRYEQVLILERDELPDAPAARTGVPQGEQPHVLLKRGLTAAEELLPGLRGELIAAGAVPIDTGDLFWLGEAGWLPVGRPGFEVVSASRPLLEAVVRRRVAGLPGVRILPATAAVGLRPEGTGWSVQTRGGSQRAGLVIDASGRSSRLSQWLTELGYPAARTVEIDARVGYATRVYAGGDVVGAPGVVVLATPDAPRGGLGLRVEGDRWLVVATGHAEHRPPRDVAGYEAFLDELRDPALAELVRRCTPLSEVAVYRQTGNRRHYYEKMPRWPDGVLAVGDALCAFNPLYGQGITVAAIEALALHRTLARPPRAGDSRRLMRQFAGLLALPWNIATGEDLRYPSSAGAQTPVQAALGAWARQLGRLATHGDDRALDTLTGVYHLMSSPVRLLHPALLVSTLRALAFGYGADAPRPVSLATPTLVDNPGR